MVLTANRLKILLALALFIKAQLIFSQMAGYSISGLVQYGENIDRERLELLEDRQVIKINGNPKFDHDYVLTGTYIIRNNGGEYRATLGILFDEWQGGCPSPALTDVQFFVDDRQVDYIEIGSIGGIVMGESERRLEQNATTWALIQVLFPESSILTIKVQYKNCFLALHPGNRPYMLVYNPGGLSYFSELLYWKGPTKFSVEVTNHFIYENNVEYYWISDIVFEPVTMLNKNDYRYWINGLIYDRTILQRQNLLRTCEYLAEMQELTTELMEIRKINRNTFRIDFTEKFMTNYNRGIIINFNLWVAESGAYIYADTGSKEITFGFILHNANISQRRLAPYELIFLTNNQLRIMRNAFYARHGYVFSSREIRDMFDIFRYSSEHRFYKPNPNFHEGMLTEIDRANIEIIRRLEVLAEN